MCLLSRLLPFCLRPHSPVPNPSRAPTTTDPLALAWQPLLSGPNARGPEVVPPS
ncbi:hypothetical protein C8Q80DRAFT_1135287 [Daedaleopsis nitida]|nr:hypothetical protein C8Q80DRAFT_1135287 [Daedaleopsis nitida]